VLAAVAPTRRRRAVGRGIGGGVTARIHAASVTGFDDHEASSCIGCTPWPGLLLSRLAISPLPGRAAYPSRVAGDHYIQAALMGRWGEPPAKAPRERTIVVRMKKPPKTFLTTPENVGKENNLYPAWVEKLWQLYEGDLIRVAGDLDAVALQQGDEAYVLLHISALKPRRASFLDDLNDYQACGVPKVCLACDLRR
jgi:hypothetical protein